MLMGTLWDKTEELFHLMKSLILALKPTRLRPGTRQIRMLMGTLGNLGRTVEFIEIVDPDGKTNALALRFTPDTHDDGYLLGWRGRLIESSESIDPGCKTHTFAPK
jgi:hypothetical protein